MRKSRVARLRSKAPRVFTPPPDLSAAPPLLRYQWFLREAFGITVRDTLRDRNPEFATREICPLPRGLVASGDRSQAFGITARDGITVLETPT